MAEIAEETLGRVRLEEDFAIERAAGKEISAARALGDDLDRLEALAAELLTVRNRVRVKARSLHTSRQVGDAQTSEAELVSAPLQRQIVDLKEHVHTCEQEIIQLTKALEAERRQSAQNMAGDHQTIVEQRQRIADLEAERDALLAEAPPAECTGVSRLQVQLDVARAQVRALQQSRTEARELAAARQTDLDEMADTLARSRKIAEQRGEQRAALLRRATTGEALLRKCVERLSHLEDPTLILEIGNHLGMVQGLPPGE